LQEGQVKKLLALVVLLLIPFYRGIFQLADAVQITEDLLGAILRK
jgi:hypothetical protein